MTEKYDPLKSPYHPLKHLAVLRYVFSDEIPPQMIHSFDRNNLYKVRGAWWASMLHNLENATRKGMITDEALIQSIGEFTTRVQAMKFGDDTPASLRTAIEIAWANKFIDSVLAATGYADVELNLESLKK